MPELQRHFRAGRMNKDLDERLVPNGEYRDAQNVEIVTSEGSDVGSVQNVLGTTEKKGKTYDITQDKLTASWSSDYISNLTSSTCIGSYVDNENNKIYWFITSTEADCIVEYDDATGVVVPILVDTGGILNFNTNNRITGINIIDAMLFWTDNQQLSTSEGDENNTYSEPKQIKISTFKDAHAAMSPDNNFNDHTKLTKNSVATDFDESDITVIKKFPLSAPVLTMSASLRTGNGTGTDPIWCKFNFSHDPAGTSQYRLMEVGKEDVEFSFEASEAPNYEIHDVLSFISSDRINDNVDDFEVKIRITELVGSTLTIKGTILSISSTIPTGPTTGDDATREYLYRVLLVEKDPLFQYKFPRFGYRWKYNDGQYSCFSPFSEVAFIASEFDYKSTDGHNLGMINKVRSLIINGFQTQPYNVEEVDILYKESNSEVVYVIDTLKDNETSYTLEKEIVESVIEPTQFLRHWDNVPRAALAQEITSNRLVYGNYIQNYNINKQHEPIIDACFISEPTTPVQWFYVAFDGKQKFFELSKEFFPDRDQIEAEELEVSLGRYQDSMQPSLISWHYEAPYVVFSMAPAEGVHIKVAYNRVRLPRKSIKSIRNYQLGVVYQDIYGRQTPVFPSVGGCLDLEKELAANKNNIQATLKNEPPPWATHYKWYIKEPSAEYYNLALDRFYPAEDGNMWLSFPSSERNKVKEGDYLLLKKEHNSHTPVKLNARYKIIAIENEAPGFIKTIKVGVADAKVQVRNNGENTPKEGTIYIEFNGPKEEDNPQFIENFKAGSVIKLKTDSQDSQFYTIIKGGLKGEQTGDGSVIYSLTIDPPVRAGDNFLNALTATDRVGDAFFIEIFAEEEKMSPEFAGRFFAKIPRDDLFDAHIVRPIAGDGTIEYKSVADIPIEVDACLKLGTQGQLRANPKAFGWQDKPRTLGNPTGGMGKKRKYIDSDEPHPDAEEILVCTETVPGKVVCDFVPPTSHQTSWGKNHPEFAGHKMSFCVAGFPWDIDDARKTLVVGDDEYNYKHDISVNPFMQKLKNGSYIQFSGAANETTGIAKRGKVYQVRKHKRLVEMRHALNDHSYSPQKGKPWTVRQIVQFEIYDPISLDGYIDDFEIDNDPITKMYIVKPQYLDNSLNLSTDKPAIFETEPQETPDLDLYHEISDARAMIVIGMSVTIDASNTTTSTIADNTVVNAHASSASTYKDGYVFFNNQQTLLTDTVLKFTNSVTGTTTTGKVKAPGVTSSYYCQVYDGGHKGPEILTWWNCFAFGNGVESNRIKDDFNAPQIDHGPKVSTIAAEQYKEENRKNGLIWSGIYNSTSGINRLHEFNMSQKITKDLNPQYGGIQKLHTRDTDITALCEDKVLRILANKDALYNADGNINLTATDKVLGQSIPYIGEYGISKNPESFVSHAYRSYFTDSARGAVLRLSRDGLTNIAEKGMTDWFKDNLPSSSSLIGTYNENKGSYNLTVDGTTDYTISFDERVNGWTSFKSFIPESGCSLNNVYYTFKNGLIYAHDDTADRNTFYGTYSNSSVNLLFNDEPSMVKSFKTLNYEGSTSREYHYGGTIGGTAYTSGNSNLLTLNRLIELKPTNGYQDDGSTLPTSTQVTKGWYAESITTDLQTGDVQEFYKKEGKWFNYIHGDTTVFDNTDTSSNNVDTSEFSVQGIDTLSGISGDTSVTSGAVTIDLDGINAQFMSIDTTRIPSGWGIDPDNSEKIYLLTDIAVGQDVGSTGVIANPTVYLIADAGYTLPSSLAIATESPSSSINVSSWTQATGALLLDIEAHTQTTSGRHITMTVNNPATYTNHTIGGTYNYNVTNTLVPDSEGAIPTTTAYSNTGTYGLREIILSVTITAKTGYVLTDYTQPNIFVKQNDPTGKYEKVVQILSYVSDGSVSIAPTSIRVDVYYTYGKTVGVSGDQLLFTGKAKIKQSTIDSLISGHQWEDEDGNVNNSVILSSGETRYLRIFGVQGVKYSLSCDTSNVKMNDSLENIVDKLLGKETPSDDDDITITNLAKSDLIKVDFPSITSTTTHTFELLGGNLASPLIPGGNPFTIKQLANVTLTVIPNSARFDASEITVFEDDDRDGVFNTSANSADSIIRTYKAGGIAEETTKYGSVPFKFVFDDSSAITLNRQPTQTDFTKLSISERTL